MTAVHARRAALGLLIGAIVVAGALLAVRHDGTRTTTDRAFADGYKRAATAWAKREAALQSRAGHASDRGGERLLALFRDARDNTTRTRRDLARLKPPAASRGDLERFDALLAQRAAALDRVLAAVRASRPEGLPVAVRDLARTSAQLQSVDRRIDQRLHGV